MGQRPYLTIIFPAYNEVETIATTINEAVEYMEQRDFSYEIIVAADGTDGTRELAAEMAQTNPHLKVIGTPERRGKGHAIRQSVLLSTGQIVGFSDADNKTPISELDKFLPFFKEGYDFVIGSRAMSDSHIERKQPWYRQLGSRGFAFFLRLTIGLYEIADTQCGFKFFRREVALDLFQRQQIDGYMYDVEILHLALQSGYQFEQVGIRWRDDHDSRYEIVQGSIRNGLDILAIRYRSAKRWLKSQLFSQPLPTKDVT